MTPFTLVTCSYNTPIVLQRCLKSFYQTHKSNEQRVLVMENSTDELTVDFLIQNKINYKRNPGMTHGQAVNLALELCETEYMLLVDSDVIFKRDTRPVLEQVVSLNATLAGRIEGDRGGKRIYKRVHPWFCLMNVNHLKQHNILFNDERKLRDNDHSGTIYDVASSMFEHVRHVGLKIAHMNVEGEYIDHWEGMSWYTNKFVAGEGDTNIDLGGTHDNIAFYKHGVHKTKMYLEQTKQLDDVVVKGVFT